MNKSILIYTDNFPYGKSEQFLEGELNYLIGSFDKIALFPVEQGKDSSRRCIPERAEAVGPAFRSIKDKIPFLIKGLFNLSLLVPLVKEGFRSGVFRSSRKFRIWFTHLLLVRGILSEIRRRDLITFFNTFDILYFYWGLRWSQILPFLPAGIKARVVVRFHGSDLYEHTNNGYIPWRYEQLSRIDKAVAISETGKKYIENQYPCLKGKIIVSRIGTEDYGLNPYEKRDSIRIVSCSNLVPVKRVELIVRTLSYINSPVNWIHFGHGPEFAAVRSEAEKLPEWIKADLRGSVPHEELINYYRTVPIDIFINASSSEGVPVSVMEAMSFGIPVVATNVGGTSEIVSSAIGLLIEPDFSSKDLADKIVKLVNGADYIRLRTAARAEWEAKSMMQNVYPAFVEVLESI
jgi:colanic acid/amylovoran biosynthesis glycosyltransferase